MMRLIPILFVAALIGTAWSPEAMGQELPAGDPSAAAPAAEASGDAPPVATAVDTDTGMTSGEAFLRKLIQGGWTIVFLLAVSVFGVAYAIERLVNLRRRAIVPPALVNEARRHWQAGDFEAVKAACRRHPSTLGRMIESLVNHRRHGSTHAGNIAGDIAARDLKRHLQRAYPLAVVATLSPLLGLLGTVIGMIGAFDKVAAAGSLGDASLLGGDISKALITTGVGLGIAVPALALYHYFKSRTSLFGIMLEEEASELIMDWFDDRPAVAERLVLASPAENGKVATAASAVGPEVPHAD
jgi:biopolymer transport protein ExbB